MRVSGTAGLWLMAIPLLGSVVTRVFSWDPLLLAVTFCIASVTYAADAALRRILNMVYLSVGTFVVVIWAILAAFDVSEPQAYAIPPGLALLAVGWNERLRGRTTPYRLTTMLGLIVLMGSTFAQSLDGHFAYAMLLGIESIIALGWGARTRSRGYVRLGGWSLIANAIVQFGPAFADLPRWIQIGVTGSILLGGGMAALFKREEILATRQKLTQEWRQWQA